jgi:hypothetical protein
MNKPDTIVQNRFFVYIFNSMKKVLHLQHLQQSENWRYYGSHTSIGRMTMFKIDTEQTRQFEDKLRKLNDRAIPFAVRQTLNDLAFATRKNAIDIIGDKMIERNRWTRGSIRLEKAQGVDTRRMMSVVGSTADYMEKQEFGHTERKTAITTSYASGEGENAKPRRRVARKANRMSSIKLKRQRNRGKTRAQRNLITVRMAAKNKVKHIYLDLGKRKGIFTVTGGKRKPRVRMVQALGHRNVVTPRNPWLRPATDKSVKRRDRFYRQALTFQLRRLTQ